MADNYKVPASKIPTAKKLLLYPGDPLIGVLDPTSYICYVIKNKRYEEFEFVPSKC